MTKIPNWIMALLTPEQQHAAMLLEIVEGEVFFRRVPGGIIIVSPEEIEEQRAIGPRAQKPAPLAKEPIQQTLDVLSALRIGRFYVARCNEVNKDNQANLDQIDAAIALVSRSLGVPSDLIGEIADQPYAGKFQ